MNKRNVGYTCLFLLFFFLLSWRMFFPLRKQNISLENYNKIEFGMEERQVEEILGCHFGFHFEGDVVFSTQGATLVPLVFRGNKANAIGCFDAEFSDCFRDPCLVTKAWIGNEIGMWLTFNQKGMVEEKRFHKVMTLEQPINNSLTKLIIDIIIKPFGL